MPSCWLYPCATNLALFLVTAPSSSNLFLKTHRVPIACLCFGRGTRRQTLFLSNWFNSSCMATIHSGSFNASLMVLGSTREINALVEQNKFTWERRLLLSNGVVICQSG